MKEESDAFNYFPLIVGWILGILSAILVEKWKQHSEKNKISKGIINELRDSQIYLSSICYVTTFDYGEFNNDFLQWWKPYYTKLINSGDFDFLSKNKDLFDKLFDLNDAELQNYKSVVRVHTNPKSTQIFKNISTPYIDSKIGAISFFNEEYQSSLFKIKREIGFINHYTEQIWYYFTKTFDNPTAGNLQLINNNLEGTFKNVAKRSKGTVELIEKFIIKYT